VGRIRAANGLAAVKFDASAASKSDVLDWSEFFFTRRRFSRGGAETQRGKWQRSWELYGR